MALSNCGGINNSRVFPLYALSTHRLRNYIALADHHRRSPAKVTGGRGRRSRRDYSPDQDQVTMPTDHFTTRYRGNICLNHLIAMTHSIVFAPVQVTHGLVIMRESDT